MPRPTKPPPAQLGLFGAPAPAESRSAVEPVDDPEARELAARLPDWIRLGTSTWTFPGWAGLVYAGNPSQAALVRAGLGAYAKHPLLRTVGIDRSFYAPIPREDLEAYARQLPPGFRAVAKMWEEVTTFAWPAHPRYGPRAGAKNDRFLDAAVARDVIKTYTECFTAYTGCILFEITPLHAGSIAPDEFARRVDWLLDDLPDGIRYAFELRNRELLTPRYLDALRAHGAAHTLNLWSAMPDVGEQLARPGVLTAPFCVCRLSLPRGTRYADRKAAFAPFDRVHDPQPDVRADVVALARACAAWPRELYVIVNNKVEGSAPLTVKSLARDLAIGLSSAQIPR